MSDIVRCNVCVFADPDTGFGRSGYGFCRKSRVGVVGKRTVRRDGVVEATLIFGWPSIAISQTSQDGCGDGKEKAAP